MYTPNGRFATGSTICTSNSNYHQKDGWQPTWTIETMMIGFLSLFLEDNSTGQVHYNHVRTTTSQKKRYAKQSIIYNRKNYINLYQCFNSDLCIEYQKATSSSDNQSNNESEEPTVESKIETQQSKPEIKIKLKLKVKKNIN